MRYLFLIMTLVLAGTPAYAQLDVTDYSPGVTCKVNGVDLIAKNAEDCARAGGEVVQAGQ